ncbi:MAG: glycosyltransferase [Candidatus Shapirobacteria bacterium]
MAKLDTIVRIKPKAKNSVIGAGVIYQKKRFITHNQLSYRQSALKTFYPRQKIFLFLVAGIIGLGLVANTRLTAMAVVAFLSLVYFLDFIFSLYVLLKSLHFPPEIKASRKELKALKNSELPIYSILCPLYQEATILPHFLKAIEKTDWPKNKLEVLFLLEENDKQTQEAADKLNLPSYVRTIIVPDSQPKTKPKACNYGLAKAKGEYIVVYDAEDKPDPLQLKKAYLAFAKLGRKFCCLQSKLNYYNTNQNLLTKLFTAEYSLWFDLILPGLQSIESIIPLGGTSNHFRTKDLKKLQGWDPFNVTEDCDLGVRIFKSGYKTGLIDSTTYEEANSNVKSWLRQRSRWIKGYLQTYLVHMRDPAEFFKNHGVQALVFQLVIGMRMIFILINPILWLTTILYFTAYRLVGPVIESLYPAPIFYLAVISLVLGNFIHLYNYMIGCAKRKHWNIIKFVFLIPAYWAMTGISAGIAVYQLFAKPYFWEKTHHGLHLQTNKRAFRLFDELKRLWVLPKNNFATGGVLVAASVLANFFNFLYNAYLGRKINLSEFGSVSLMGSFLYLFQIPMGALETTITNRSAYLFGRYKRPVLGFWNYVRKNSAKISLAAVGLWLLGSPAMAKFFRVDSLIPFLLFAPVWFVGTIMTVDLSYLMGNLRFAVIAGITVVEALSKLLLAIFFVKIGKTQWVYAALPLSITLAFLAADMAAKKLKARKVPKMQANLLYFPKRFFASSLLLGLSSVAFLSFDLILAKHFLSPQAAGEYALLSLIGKMVFLAGSLFLRFINPLVSRQEGENEDASKVFYQLLLVTMAISMVGWAAVGLLGRFTVPLLFGSEAKSIVYLLPVYTMAMANFAMGSSFVLYHQARKHCSFSFVSLFIALAQVLAIVIYHNDIQAIVKVVAVTGLVYFAFVVLFHFIYDFFSTFSQAPVVFENKGNKLRILILNWRDTKHVWAGGAEVYVHELAKRWVAKGHEVTVFCSNDGQSRRDEIIDGVQIVRRGGFYLVYFWAFLYYVFKFKNQCDIIVDSENGIPFFSPLYVKQPVIGLVHHVHQEIILKELKLKKWLLPVAFVAKQLESKLMPVVYKNSQMITVSDSSKDDMEKIGLGKSLPVKIVHPGVDLSLLKPTQKTKNPTVLYLGRLKAYKSIDVLIKAVSNLLPSIPDLELKIAGFGDDRKNLEKLTKTLRIEKHVKFLGKVTEKNKIKLLGSSWVFAYPSTMEGWGISAIEANACGTPVVAFNVPGLRDSVHNPESGFLVKKGDLEGYKRTIGLLVADEKLRKRLGKGSVLWASRFSWNTSADDFLRIINKAVDQNKFNKKER